MRSSEQPSGNAPTHEHVFVFSHTVENWFDGDEVDVWKCSCGERKKEYIPR